jgi:transposase
LSKNDFTRVLGTWEGYVLGPCERFEAGAKGSRAEVWIELRLEAPHRPGICSGCGLKVEAVHEFEERWVRDLPILDAETHILVQQRRLACPRCGPKVEKIGWLDRYARHTRRLAESVARMCQSTTIKSAAEFYGLSRRTVKRIDKEYLEETLGPPDLSGLEAIAMDEFSIPKGHRYATVIVEPSRKRVLWIGRGRGREDVRPFFELLAEGGRKRLKAVAMDMNAAYEQEVRCQCPGAPIVYDLFHVVAKYGREVIDRVRVDEANRLRYDRPARKVIKGSRWLLLRNRSNIAKRQDRVRLSELLAANRKLATVYVLKDDLKHLWDYRYVGAARRFWEQWRSRAMHSQIKPLKAFAQNLRGYLDGILAHCRWPLHTSLLEGINNTIKVIKRMAYGFRDDEYFFLKIRHAFPGIGP